MAVNPRQAIDNGHFSMLLYKSSLLENEKINIDTTTHVMLI